MMMVARFGSSRAIVAFRENEGSDGKADEFARRALRANDHVPAVLTGKKKAKRSIGGYLTMGGEDESILCRRMGLRLGYHSRRDRVADKNCG